MKKPENVLCSFDHPGVATISLNRPDVHNAFDIKLLEELEATFYGLKRNKKIRVVVLKGEGRSFSSGADLNWMKAMKKYTKRENMVESKRFAHLFHEINNFPKPIICQLHGAVLGGATGLAAVCDYVIAEHQAVFGFTEVRIGLIPAVISPFVIAKIGESNARAYFLSGIRFNADKAKEIGLVHEVVDTLDLEKRVETLVGEFLHAAPEAATKAKILIKEVIAIFHGRKRPRLPLTDFTSKEIAARRISKEGQEGMTALLKHRKPKWME